MADKWYTAASGNWSTAANWNGGTLPTSADDVFADGKAVVIDQNVTVLSIRTTQRSGGTIGGTFTISAAGITVNCTSSGILSGTSAGALLITATTGTTTLNSNLTAGASALFHACVLSGATTLTISGNLLAANNSGIALLVTSTSTVNITGNITGGSSSGHAVSITGIATFNVTGNITGGISGSHGVSITAAATLNVTGNVTGGTSSSTGISNTSVAATINIIGNVTAQTGAGISSAIASVVTIKGIITSTNTIAGVSLSSTSVSLTFSGTAINSSNGVMAIYSPNIKLYNANTVEWRFRDELGNVKTLYSAGIALGNPATTDVRNGTTYGASSELTGSMIVPNPSDVRISVPTDNTVGTGQLTAADFLAAISGSADAIATRLRNVSTVDTTGAQMASYNI
jgi:hypothetical protein